MNRRSLFLTASVIMTVTFVLVVIIGARFSQRGKWLPEPPSQIDEWTAIDMPLGESAVAALGGSPLFGRRYVNPFNERVECHVISATSYDSYREPAMLQPGFGYSLTAEKTIPLFGKDRNVRAVILRSTTDGQRVLLYSWVQNRDGTTSTRTAVNNYRDLFPRLTIGFYDVVEGKQSCIIRAYTQIHSADNNGVQARRNLNAVARGLYEEFVKDGAKR